MSCHERSGHASAASARGGPTTETVPCDTGWPARDSARPSTTPPRAALAPRYPLRPTTSRSAPPLRRAASGRAPERRRSPRRRKRSCSHPRPWPPPRAPRPSGKASAGRASGPRENEASRVPGRMRLGRLGRLGHATPAGLHAIPRGHARAFWYTRGRAKRGPENVRRARTRHVTRGSRGRKAAREGRRAARAAGTIPDS